MKEAIILAGGFGTRLKSIVSKVPKPMAPLNGKPFLEFLLDKLVLQEFDHVILSVGHLHSVITEYFGGNFKSLKIDYAIETSPLGTGGAIQESLRLTKSDQIYILNGDTYFDIEIDKLSLPVGCKVSLSLKEEKDVSRYGSVQVNENGFISCFIEKGNYGTGLINGGIYLINRNIFNLNTIRQKKFSFEDFLHLNFRVLNAYSFVSKNDFIDIGVPEDYERAKKFLIYK